MGIFLNQLIQFHLNNTLNLPPLTQCIIQCYTQQMAIVLWPYIMWHYCHPMHYQHESRVCLISHCFMIQCQPSRKNFCGQPERASTGPACHWVKHSTELNSEMPATSTEMHESWTESWTEWKHEMHESWTEVFQFRESTYSRDGTGGEFRWIPDPGTRPDPAMRDAI